MSVAVTAAWVGVGASAHQARTAGDDASKARKTTKNWRLRGIEETERQYDQTREDLAPWREAGQNALQRLQDPTAFETSPGYEFRRSEGIRNAENVFSNRSGGGNAMRALNDYNQNMASNEYGNWWNRQAGLAGVGQSATQATGAFGAQAANSMSNQYGGIGDNLASIGLYGNAQQTNALNSGISNLLYGLQKNYSAPTKIGTGRSA